MLPLAGIRVVEIAENLAGPFAGQVLALLGAEVLKVERPEGDNARGWGPPFHEGMATTFHAVNQNKHSVTLDFRKPDDLAWVRARIAASDVVVQNMRPGSLEKLGLGAEALCAANPRLVYCSLWALGAVGPQRLAPGFEPIVQAFSGLFSLNGDPAGLGAVVDPSLLETAMGWMTGHWAAFAESGKLPQRDRTGNPRVVVFQALPTADRELVVAAANDRLFAKLAAELGHPEWAADARYATNAARAANKDEIIGLIGAVMRTRPSAHWSAVFAAAGVPAAPINDMSVLLDDPQVAALGLPLSFDGARPPVTGPAPALGDHNEIERIPGTRT